MNIIDSGRCPYEYFKFHVLQIWISWMKFKPCSFESGPRKYLTQSCIFFQRMTKKLQVVVWSSRCKICGTALDPIIVIFFCKKYICRENHKLRFNYFWTCDFPYINILWKKKYNNCIKCKLPKSRFKWQGFNLWFFQYFLNMEIQLNIPKLYKNLTDLTDLTTPDM